MSQQRFGLKLAYIPVRALLFLCRSTPVSPAPAALTGTPAAGHHVHLRHHRGPGQRREHQARPCLTAPDLQLPAVCDAAASKRACLALRFFPVFFLDKVDLTPSQLNAVMALMPACIAAFSLAGPHVSRAIGAHPSPARAI